MNPENTPISTEIQKKSSWKGVVKEIVIFAVIAFGIVLPFRIYIAEPYLVDGKSMYPTFDTGNYLIVNKLSYETGKLPERNSVVIFKYPNDTSKRFIKRIIGLPGETVKISDDTVTIINSDNPNGFTLPQDYVVYKLPATTTEMTLASDEYFVMGDNRLESFDSRYWGPLNKKYILGEPVLELYPFSKIGFMPGAVK